MCKRELCAKNIIHISQDLKKKLKWKKPEKNTVSIILQIVDKKGQKYPNTVISNNVKVVKFYRVQK